MKRVLIYTSILIHLFSYCKEPETYQGKPILGVYQIHSFLPRIQGVKVGLVVNQTSMIGNTHLVDTLLKLGVDIKAILAPEHGFRGEVERGKLIDSSKDTKTGLPVISLYGKNKKPSPEQIQDLDLIIFDIQDVGARFFTYISTLHLVMEACAENDVKLMVLDRPNPNGHYVDGAVLQHEFKSFVGMHPIPIVHGLTVGELAGMINGERWLSGGIQCDLEVVPVKNYDHKTPFSLPLKPSPNLPNDQSVRLYPFLCLFEGTPVSVGRGTETPFQIIGYPDPEFGDFEFIPRSIPVMASQPKFQDQTCFGIDLQGIVPPDSLDLNYLIKYYKIFPDSNFFTGFFNKLAGNSTLREKIESGWTEAEIRDSWSKDLENYKAIRKKYLLYEDFE